VHPRRRLLAESCRNLRLSKWKYAVFTWDVRPYMTTGLVLTLERGGGEEEKYVLMNITCNEGFLSFQNGPSLAPFPIAKAPLKILQLQ